MDETKEVLGDQWGQTWRTLAEEEDVRAAGGSDVGDEERMIQTSLVVMMLRHELSI